jgi:hypothetical protein
MYCLHIKCNHEGGGVRCKALYNYSNQCNAILTVTASRRTRPDTYGDRLAVARPSYPRNVIRYCSHGSIQIFRKLITYSGGVLGYISIWKSGLEIRTHGIIPPVIVIVCDLLPGFSYTLFWYLCWTTPLFQRHFTTAHTHTHTAAPHTRTSLHRSTVSTVSSQCCGLWAVAGLWLHFVTTGIRILRCFGILSTCQ